MGAKFCSCPHVATATGLMRSGWSIDCPFHGGHAPHAAHQPPLQGTINVTVPPTTPPPVSEERLRELVDHNNLLADDCKTSRGTDSVLGEQYRHASMAMTELLESRTTIAALTHRLDVAEATRSGEAFEGALADELHKDTIAALRKEVATTQSQFERLRDQRDYWSEQVAALTDDLSALRGAWSVADAERSLSRAEVTRLIAERDELRRDAGRIDLIASEYLHVVPFDMPTGAGDADVGWRILQSRMGHVYEVEIAVEYSDDVRKAIDAAMAAEVPHE